MSAPSERFTGVPSGSALSASSSCAGRSGEQPSHQPCALELGTAATPSKARTRRGHAAERRTDHRWQRTQARLGQARRLVVAHTPARVRGWGAWGSLGAQSGSVGSSVRSVRWLSNFTPLPGADTRRPRTRWMSLLRGARPAEHHATSGTHPRGGVRCTSSLSAASPGRTQSMTEKIGHRLNFNR